ncbi:hypothetical protein ACX95U_001801 [Enterobacter hormaechei]|uniref:hypothetical protein n=1 Tax=Enterobacter cloacae complex TaxID=354276 RepID=UPI0022E3576E|nr:hypothetical protein [Enterobacter kobei]EKP1098578.1 hypothetical protein [Enterobacter hormaechei]ELX8426807.1 hypothetical protein [Enterobacter hormaechei subsp. hoffmannii]HAS1030674.1 hypothetical protein [Enterobacter cloacae]EKS6523169.1 hypothetical protein [Enterobacter hormaechei]EKU5014212.1 hypothetical protein [Enterobacter hormaechei]
MKVRKFANKLKDYSFFDLNPKTDYFSLLDHKSNNEKLNDALILMCARAKETLLEFDADFKCKHHDYDSELNDKLIKLYIDATYKECKHSQMKKHVAATALYESSKKHVRHNFGHSIDKDGKNVQFFSAGGNEIGRGDSGGECEEISILIKRLAERA